MFLIRDSELEVVDLNGKAITPDEYINTRILAKVKGQKGTTKDLQAQNEVRKLIKEHFPEIGCVMLRKPNSDDTNTKQLS